MNVHELVSQLITETRGTSLPKFAPELILCGTIVLNLIFRMTNIGRTTGSFGLVFIGTLLALMLAEPWSLGSEVQRVELFSGMLVYDGFSVLMRSLLLIFVLFFVVLTRLTGIPDREDSADIFTLVLGATIGMMMMCSANHLLMVFMSVEMASVPSYALAGLLKGRRQSSEAALKYAVYGAGTAGVMLYGISLISGLVNTVHLPTIAQQLAIRIPTMGSEECMVLGLGGLMLGVGLAFKLSAVPFHFWCPDVFEGATAEVNAFLSVASKAAALALLVRVALGMGVAESGRLQVAHAAPTTAVTGLFAIADDVPSSETLSTKARVVDSLKALAPVRGFTAKLIALIAIITCTFGNLAAYGQTNIKRLFAYSTIAHAGYMMMAVPAILAAVGAGPAGITVAEQGASAIGLYVGVYVAMNLGAFAIIAFFRNAMRSEEIADYAGMLRRAPVMTVCFVIILFSLVGLPPLAGFFGKFAVFSALVDSYRVVSANQQSGSYLIWLLIFGGLNTVVSLYYYLRIVKVMTWDTDTRDRPPFISPLSMLHSGFVCLLTLPTLGWIVCFELLAKWCANASSSLL